jgi:hypothetical protein
LTGYAVTPGLREWYADADIHELEYAATARAARASLRLLQESEPRRVVLAVDAPDAAVSVRDDLDEGAVELSAAVPWPAVAAALVDAQEAEDDVRLAIGQVDAADLGDADAEFAVSSTEDHELLWYATQEIPDLPPPA